MRIKSLLHRLVFFVLALLIVPVLAFPVYAKGNNPQTLQLSSSGQGRAFAVTYSPDGQILAVGSSLGIYFFNSSTLQMTRFIPTDSWVRTVAFSPDGSMLVSGSYDAIVRLWRVSDGSEVLELKGHEAWVRSISYSPDGSMLATASDDDTVRLWDVSSGNPILVLREGTQGIRAVAFSPDGAILATGGFDNVVRLWRVIDGTLLYELTGHADWIRCLAFSPDGTLLTSSGFDSEIFLWNVENGEKIRTLKGHSSSVLGLVFSPDGKLLASGSVDTTVRLWRMPEGEPYDLLEDHSDFVYSVSFSPDGRKLLSGAADNSVKLWDVPQEANPSIPDFVSSPSTCKACHHPRSNSLPARVIETGCATCHQNGALVLNWCPVLDRPFGNITSKVVYNPQVLEGGTPKATSNFGVVIATPGNGEHLYTPQDIYTFIPISGYVFSDITPLNEIQLKLVIWSGAKQVASVSTNPGANGTFSFPVNIRPKGGEPFPDLDGQKFNCSNCHKAGALTLPPGEVLLDITATAPDGTKASDKRLIYVDHSETVSVLVNVFLEDGQRAPAVPLQAATRLYEWRGRTFNAFSDTNGQATFQVEALSQISTSYQIFVPPVVIGEVLYESVEPVEIILSPGAMSTTSLNLHIRMTKGQLSGQLTPPIGDSVDILAVRLSDGAIFRTQSFVQGGFTFSEIPIGSYLVTVDEEDLLDIGMVSQPQAADLYKQPNTLVELPLSPNLDTSVAGTVYQEGGEEIPFAYISSNDLVTPQAVLPESGQFTLVNLPPKTLTLVVSAPGFYSQAHIVDPKSSQPLDLPLVIRPETSILPWGSGQVVVPPETQLTVDGVQFTLKRGWLWGNGGNWSEPLEIRLDAGKIVIKSGHFALEHIPGQAAWFYLYEGQANFQAKRDSKPVAISGGQMIRITEDLHPVPVPYDPVVISLLRTVDNLPIELTWQMSPGAQIRDRLAQVGISTAQFMTFITYLMAFLTLLIVPVLVVNWLIKSRKARKHV